MRNQRHITLYSDVCFWTFHDIVSVLRTLLFIVIFCCCDTDTSYICGTNKGILKQIGIQQKSSFLMCEKTVWGDNEMTGCDVEDTMSLDSGILFSRVQNEFFVSWRDEWRRQTSCSFLKTRLCCRSDGLLTFTVIVKCFHQIFQVLMWQTLSHHLIHTAVWSAADKVSL